MNAENRDKQLIGLLVEEINAWSGSTYIVERWPDEEVRNQPAVDAIAVDAGGRQLAIEHTLLQPFEGERTDAYRFMKVAGHLDQRQDLADPNWMIDLVFDVGSIPTCVDWGAVGVRLEEWFVELRPRLLEGTSHHEIPGMVFPLRITVEKSPLPGTPGCLFVMRAMPREAVDPILRTALDAKLPKLVAADASDRVLLLELESPARGNAEISLAIRNAASDFPQLDRVSAIWLARSTAWEAKGYLGFHLVWPEAMVSGFQDWRRARPNRRHSVAGVSEDEIDRD